MPNDPFLALAVAVIDRGIARFERTGTPDPDTARGCFASRALSSFETGEPCHAVPWLVRYLLDCQLVAA